MNPIEKQLDRALEVIAEQQLQIEQLKREKQILESLMCDKQEKQDEMGRN